VTWRNVAVGVAMSGLSFLVVTVVVAELLLEVVWPSLLVGILAGGLVAFVVGPAVYAVLESRAPG
jgi:hypothetical protein